MDEICCIYHVYAMLLWINDLFSKKKYNLIIECVMEKVRNYRFEYVVEHVKYVPYLVGYSTHLCIVRQFGHPFIISQLSP